MNAIELLKSDHRRVEELFDQFKNNEDGSNGALFKKIRDELVVHTHIEEVIFYPDLVKRGKKDLKDLVREGVEEHLQVKQILKDLEKMTPRNKAFNPKLKVIVEDVEHHVKEEEDDMFKMVEDQLTGSRLETLGKEMEAEKLRKQKKLGIKPAVASRIEKGLLDTVLETTKDLLAGSFLSSNEPSRSRGATSKSKSKSKAKNTGKKRSSGSPKAAAATRRKPTSKKS